MDKHMLNKLYLVLKKKTIFEDESLKNLYDSDYTIFEA